MLSYDLSTKNISARRRNLLCKILNTIGIILITSAIILPITIVVTKTMILLTISTNITGNTTDTNGIGTTTKTTMTKGSLCYVGTTLKPRWKQNGINVAGGSNKGSNLNQLDQPMNVAVDDDQTMYISDSGNRRIMEWKNGASMGKVLASRYGETNITYRFSYPYDILIDHENDSLIICDSNKREVIQWSRRNNAIPEAIITNIDCRDLAMDNNRDLYVVNFYQHEVRRYRIGVGDVTGTIVAGGNGCGDRLHQICYPESICVDQNYTVYVADRYHLRVVKWMKGAEEGIIVAGDQGPGDGAIQLASITGLAVDPVGAIYILDGQNYRVMRWFTESIQPCIVVGGNGAGKKVNQLNMPEDLLFDRQGNIYIVDSGNHRILKFKINL